MAGAILVLAGSITFLVCGGGTVAWMLPALLLSLFIAWRWPLSKPAPQRWSCFLPLASGLLIWPMRLFYWDRGDFSARVHNLLLLAALLSFWLLGRQKRWPRRFLRFFNALDLKKRLLAIFIATEMLFIAAAGILTRKGVALGGDEPHYLAITQSIAKDGDLNVFNQYFRGGYKDFLDVEKLRAHGTWGKGFKEIYSYHLPGVSLTVTPFFFFKVSPPLLYFLLRAWLGLFGALLAVLAYLFVLRLWQSRSMAFFAVLVFALTAPVFFYSFHLFPEVQAVLLVLSALYLLLYKAEANGARCCLLAGLLLGSTIFWGVKYALFIYPLTIGFFIYWLRRKRFRHALLLLLFPIVFQALFFLYLYSAYGTFSPNAVYYGMLDSDQSRAFYDTILKRIPFQARWETLLDYFFDQRDGLLPYNPLYFFALPGLLLALKNFRRYRLHLLIALPAALFIFNHAFSTIRPGYCPQGRYLTPAVWALLLFALIYYRESRNHLFRKAVLALPAYSFFVVLYQVIKPFTLYQPTTHDITERAGLMFRNWSNSRIDLPSLLPSFIKTDNRGYLPNIVFLALLVIMVILALVRMRAGNSRRLGGGAIVIVFLGAFSLSSLFPRLDTADGRLIPGPRGLPCKVYLSPPGISAGGNAAWLGSGRKCRLRIESLVPLKSIRLRMRNRSIGEPLTVTAAVFDADVTPRRIPAQAAAEIGWDRPHSKRIKNRYGYQIELKARNDARDEAAPAWLLALTLR